MGIPIYDGYLAKPSAQGFLEVCRIMNFDHGKTWMIGDNPLTDGGAVGVLEGMAFVKPIGIDLRYVPSAKKRTSMYFSALFRQFAINRTLRNNSRIHLL